MNSRVQKWGNSLAVRIPSAFARQVGLSADTPVRIVVEGTRLVIEPANRLRLDELLEQVTPENLHDETDWGTPVGRELW